MANVATADLHADDAHHGPEHDYHLVDPSPWPFITSFAAMLAMIMVIVTFQNKGGAYFGYEGGALWSAEFEPQLAEANASIAAGSPDYALVDRLVALGARDMGQELLAPVASVWTDAARQALASADGDFSALDTLVGATGATVNDRGEVSLNGGAAVICGAGNLFACELQADGTFQRAGLAFGFGLAPLFLGLIPLIFCMGMWWRDVVREATVEGHHTPIVQLGLRYGMLLFIVSEIFFFVAFFWAFFENSAFEPWPSQEFRDAMTAAGKNPDSAAFHPLGIPLYNTVILLLSGTTVTQAHEALRENKMDAFKNWLLITVLLGILFTAVQVYEYTELPFGFTSQDYGSVFYAATGFHGFHVLVGTIFLAVCWFRARARQFTPEHHFGFEAAAWYWHFVDVVWVFLYVAVYWGLFVTNSTFHH